MPEVIIKYKNEQALKALQDLAKMFGMSIKRSSKHTLVNTLEDYEELPITFAKKPNVKALAGIWEDRDISLEQLRKEAWGDRI